MEENVESYQSEFIQVLSQSETSLLNVDSYVALVFSIGLLFRRSETFRSVVNQGVSRGNGISNIRFETRCELIAEHFPHGPFETLTEQVNYIRQLTPHTIRHWQAYDAQLQFRPHSRRLKNVNYINIVPISMSVEEENYYHWLHTLIHELGHYLIGNEHPMHKKTTPGELEDMTNRIVSEVLQSQASNSTSNTQWESSNQSVTFNLRMMQSVVNNANDPQRLISRLGDLAYPSEKRNADSTLYEINHPRRNDRPWTNEEIEEADEIFRHTLSHFVNFKSVDVLPALNRSKRSLSAVLPQFVNRRQSKWDKFYTSPLTYSSQGRSFLYLHEEFGHGWFISELFPNGTLSKSATDKGDWTYKYSSVIPFKIDGRTFFYGYNNIRPANSNTYGIRELLPNGKMGNQTDFGMWDTNYSTMFAFSLNGKTFLLQENASHEWKIRELLPGGIMGEVTQTGTIPLKCDVLFPYYVDGRVFAYGQNKINGFWCIIELLPGGKMGEHTDYYATTSYYYYIQFPFVFEGRNFLYRSNTDELEQDDNTRIGLYTNWIIHELLPNGKMGQQITKGVWGGNFQIQIPYTVGGKVFFYMTDSWDNRWYINEVEQTMTMTATAAPTTATPTATPTATHCSTEL
uniref:Uncharacterized protein n=1 Tax=Cacopsylla melanoneura TaxID=428564 RepID=A0A8D8SID9_9HEMI